MILKPNMAIAGKKSAKRASVDEVAEQTVKLLKACVPAPLPGSRSCRAGSPTRRRPRISTP